MDVQAPLLHAAWAWAKVVVQALPQAPQSVALFVVSTHVIAHAVGVAAGHPDAHAYVLPEPAHTGVAPEQLVLQPPHVAACEMSVSQPSAGLPSQSIQPGAHDPAANAQAPPVHDTAPLTCARFVQSSPHALQLWVSLGTHAEPHTIDGAAQDPAPPSAREASPPSA